MTATALTQQDINKNTDLLIAASRKGDIETVKRLIPVSDPKTHNSFALRFAVGGGHTEIVQLLIPVSEPKAKHSLALQIAANGGYIDIIQLLVPVSDCSLAIARMTQHGKDATLLLQCVGEYEAVQQKERIENALQDIGTKLVTIKRKL